MANDLRHIQKYLTVNRDKFAITTPTLSKFKGYIDSKDKVDFSSTEGSVHFTITQHKPLVFMPKLIYRVACKFSINGHKWEGSYSDLIHLAKLTIDANDGVSIDFAEKRFTVVLQNDLHYERLPLFLEDLDVIFTQFYKTILKLYNAIDATTVDHRDSIAKKSLIQKYTVVFAGKRLFMLANEIL